MMDEDQADGTPPTGKAIDWTLVARRDEARLKHVKDIYQRGRLMTGANDYFNAALILQHGNTPQDYLLAHELAAVAISKKRGLDPWEWSAKIAS